MPTTRKQKKARKSIEVEMLSDIKTLVVMLGGNHLERDESETSVLWQKVWKSQLWHITKSG